MDSHQTPMSYEQTYGGSHAPQSYDDRRNAERQRADEYYAKQSGRQGEFQGYETAAPHQVYSVNGSGNQAVQRKIEQIAFDNKLQSFYPQPKLQAVIDRASQIDYNELARKWKFPNVELAIDFAALALYDIVILADDSGSMQFEENGERIDDLNTIVAKVSEIATLFDSDGIVVRPLNGTAEGNGIKNADEATRFVKGLRYGGSTPLGTKLYEKILKPFVYDQISSQRIEKPILAIIITDGSPTDSTTFERNIRSVVDFCGKSRYGQNAIAIQIAQVGKDERARQFLARIDNDPVIGPFVDATSYFELEQDEMRKKNIDLTPELWLLKMMVGAIDRSYDEMDE